MAHRLILCALLLIFISSHAENVQNKDLSVADQIALFGKQVGKKFIDDVLSMTKEQIQKEVSVDNVLAYINSRIDSLSAWTILKKKISGMPLEPIERLYYKVALDKSITVGISGGITIALLYMLFSMLILFARFLRGRKEQRLKD